MIRRTFPHNPRMRGKTPPYDINVRKSDTQTLRCQRVRRIQVGLEQYQKTEETCLHDKRGASLLFNPTRRCLTPRTCCAILDWVCYFYLRG